MADYKKMYAILCCAMSDAIDQLEDVPSAIETCRMMRNAMRQAEEVYLQASYLNPSKTENNIIVFKLDKGVADQGHTIESK